MTHTQLHKNIIFIVIIIKCTEKLELVMAEIFFVLQHFKEVKLVGVLHAEQGILNLPPSLQHPEGNVGKPISLTASTGAVR